jgi:hypothetical protein
LTGGQFGPRQLHAVRLSFIPRYHCCILVLCLSQQSNLWFKRKPLRSIKRHTGARFATANCLALTDGAQSAEENLARLP